MTGLIQGFGIAFVGLFAVYFLIAREEMASRVNKEPKLPPLFEPPEERQARFKRHQAQMERIAALPRHEIPIPEPRPEPHRFGVRYRLPDGEFYEIVAIAESQEHAVAMCQTMMCGENEGWEIVEVSEPPLSESTPEWKEFVASLNSGKLEDQDGI